MMTFEEFFIKKKIDLTHLRQVHPSLYEEFRNHYAQMGEKSFDHTKKYWFNRLRKDFLLPDPVKPVPEKPAAPAAKTTPASADNPETPSSNQPPAVKPAGFTPRFKPGVTATKPAAAQAQSGPETGTPETAKETPEPGPPAAAKPVGFKPRFKPGITGVKKDPPKEND